MAKEIYWIKDIDVEEVSAVNLAANRKRFSLFKSADGGDMRDGIHSRRTKQDGTPPPEEMPADQTPADQTPTEPVVEDGVVLYPWQQAVEDMSTAFSMDDGPRIAALLLAKFGEGSNGAIKLPADADPVEEAKMAITEGEKLMSAKPLLNPDGNAKATTVTKTAAKAGALQALGEFFAALGIGTKTNKPTKKKDGATATAEPENATILAELRKLNAHMASLNPDEEEEKEDEDAAGDPDATEEGADESEEQQAEGDDATSDDDEGEKSTDRVIAMLAQMNERLTALEQSKGIKPRPGSKAVVPGATSRVSGRKVYSSILGASLPVEDVEKHSKKRAGAVQ